MLRILKKLTNILNKLIALQRLDIKERMDALVEKVKSLNEEQAKKVMI